MLKGTERAAIASKAFAKATGRPLLPPTEPFRADEGRTGAISEPLVLFLARPCNPLVVREEVHIALETPRSANGIDDA